MTTVQVSGPQVGVHYFLEPGTSPNQNDVNWFHINNTTGVITVAKALDREVHPKHKKTQNLFLDISDVATKSHRSECFLNSLKA